jgi:hypothetical protein
MVCGNTFQSFFDVLNLINIRNVSKYFIELRERAIYFSNSNRNSPIDVAFGLVKPKAEGNGYFCEEFIVGP